MRKIIQIQAIPTPNDEIESIYVLCNDGTVWWRTPRLEQWVQLPEVPQPVAPPPLSVNRDPYGKDGRPFYTSDV